MGPSKLILWFEEIGQEHNNIVGKKCANLGEMVRMGFPVPPGFAICIDMYKQFIEETKTADEISHYVMGLGELKGLRIAQCDEISQKICCMIEGKPIPKRLERMIASYYEELSKSVGISDVPVSVRSAGTESRPGMFETYLNVKGKKEVLDKVKKVWASAFSARAIAFRANKGIPVDFDMLGVGVPKMINARSAGIGFTIDPVSGDSSRIVIEANWGLGEGVVSGVESVDRFVVDKQNLEIVERAVGKKLRHVVNRKGGAKWADVPVEMQSIPCIADEEIKEIARLAKSLEERLGKPQDMEWAIDPDFSFPQNIFLLQTRPAKVAVKKPESASEQLADRLVSSFKQIDLSKAKDKMKDIKFRF